MKTAFQSKSLANMLFLLYVAAYSLTTICVCGVDIGDYQSRVEDDKIKTIDFDKLGNLLETLDLSRSANVQKRSCRVGIHNHHCPLLDLMEARRNKEYVQSGESPGKRDIDDNINTSSSELTPDEAEQDFSLREVSPGSSQAISYWRRLLGQTASDAASIAAVKRDCRFRLGGHCLTEALDRAANQYYYLKSPDSPGRRRRDVLVTSQKNAPRD